MQTLEAKRPLEAKRLKRKDARIDGGMQEIPLRCGLWYGDEEMMFQFPGDWEIRVMGLNGTREALTDEEIRERFEHPTGTLPLREMARGHRDAVVIVDDLSRPTPAHRLVPLILNELNEGGIADDAILIIVGLGCHFPMTRIDLMKKLGEDVLRRVEIICHNIDDEMSDLGTSSFGTPIHINRFVTASDLKIGVGGIYPHAGPGFGGGAKIVVPGVAGLETTRHNHSLESGGVGGDLRNPTRMDMEEIAEKVGLDFIANVVLNGRREIVGLFVGHPVEAHREGVGFVREVSGLETWPEADVVVANAYPMDTAYIYVGKGAWPLWEAEVKEGAVKILVAACPEGAGIHRLYTRGRMVKKQNRKIWESKFIIYSPFDQPLEAYKVYPDAFFFHSWSALMEEVAARVSGKEVKVAVYPCPALQVPKGG